MIKETCAPKDGINAFVESIYSIIDSKIEYLDCQARERLHPLIGENTLTNRLSPKERTLKDLKIEEQWFLAFEKNSKIRKILLLLKKHLFRNKENLEKVMLVSSLLADDQYITLSQKDLEYRLGIRQRCQAA